MVELKDQQDCNLMNQESSNDNLLLIVDGDKVLRFRQRAFHDNKLNVCALVPRIKGAIFHILKLHGLKQAI